mmetsp:Transcript_23370/g.55319  ORF Transcript_23370/g.55319 Transcript_23370/m.55319 type:complete len:201 (+) Transcript_23370:1337-1939(+)
MKKITTRTTGTGTQRVSTTGTTSRTVLLSRPRDDTEARAASVAGEAGTGTTVANAAANAVEEITTRNPRGAPSPRRRLLPARRSRNCRRRATTTTTSKETHEGGGGSRDDDGGGGGGSHRIAPFQSTEPPPPPAAAASSASRDLAAASAAAIGFRSRRRHPVFSFGRFRRRRRRLVRRSGESPTVEHSFIHSFISFLHSL